MANNFLHKTKILHILYSGLGGHGNVFFSLIKADKKNEFYTEALFNGIEDVRQEYIEKCKHYNIKYTYVRKTPGLDVGYYRLMYRAIKKSKCDIVFLHSSGYILPAVIAKWFGKNKIKIVIRETQANHLKTKMDWVWLAVGTIVSDKIVFLSKEYAKEISKKLRLIYNSKKVRIIPNGIDLNCFYPVSPVPGNFLVIGMQSRIINIKDHLTLLRAFSLLKKEKKIEKPIKLKIAGDGNFKNEVVKYSTDLNLQDDVEFTGILTEKELVIFLQSLNVYVHASLGETMSTAIMQAMATGLPVVASDVKGINNMIKNNITGLLAKVRDEYELADQIAKCLNDAELRTLLSQNALAYARENFSNETMINSYKEFVFSE